MVKKYIPEKGDLVYINFNPQQGHEQSGKRPALIISPRQYNAPSGLALMCPITSHVKGYPFEVVLNKNSKIKGVVLSDQIKSLDWKARGVKLIEKAETTLVEEVIQKLETLIK